MRPFGLAITCLAIYLLWTNRARTLAHQVLLFVAGLLGFAAYFFAAFR